MTRFVASGDAGEQVAELIATKLRDVPDFPQPGVVFKDIVGVLAAPDSLTASVAALAALAQRYAPIDLVAGIEARGFLLCGALAHQLGCGLVPVRKAGKLPPPTLAREYQLEYGTATIEVPGTVLTGRRVLLVDDVLATGGTLGAAAALIGEAGGCVVAAAVVVEITSLGGRANLDHDLEVPALLRV